MKIGIITFHWATNYGAVLQTYALQEFLKLLGYEVKVINYIPKGLKVKWFSVFYHPSLLLRPIRYFRRLRKESRIERFRETYLERTVECNRDSIVEISSEFDVIISGSDQILNPSFTLGGEGVPNDTYYLGFCKNSNILRIGYAVSFGCVSYPDKARKYAEQWINNFSNIGVRETSGLSILKELSFNNKSIIVPDPTILYGNHLFDKFKLYRIVERKYICAYILHRVITFDNNDVVYIDDGHIGPTLIEWLSYIKYADYMVTNSYHGMIMSILFHTPFSVLLEDGIGKGMNDRFITLLERLGLLNRICNLNNVIIHDEIDWSLVEQKLSDFRQIGKSFLNL